MTVNVRFAPSPTGLLHIGNVRTALVNWLFAKKQGGNFLLRLDDTDQERSKPEFEAGIREDLQWLGLTWDREARQMAHTNDYKAAGQKLIDAGRLYPCYETPEELDFKRKNQLSRGVPPVYDRSGLKITKEEQEKLEAEGRKPHWRFLLADEDVQWNDIVRGSTRFEAKHMSDPVLFRADGIPTYTLSSVEDDGRLGITHVIRGEDHVTNTAVQIQLFKALGYKVPDFAHLALLKTATGEMSKRVGGFDIRDLRARGVEPLAIASLLARLGTSDPVELRTSLQDLATHFELTHFGRAPVVYDEVELWRLNAKRIAHLSFADVKAPLSALFNDTPDEAFWLAVRGNLEKLSDAATWWEVCRKPLAPVIEDAGFTADAAKLLPEGIWTAETWKTWTKTVQEKTGRKGKALFHPLRLALTGVEHGPELALLLPLIGQERTRARLEGRTA